MWCAYVFAIIAFIGLSPALKPGGEGLIAWIAQTFLQLVLLSVIMVGQAVQSAASDARSEQTSFQDRRRSWTPLMPTRRVKGGIADLMEAIEALGAQKSKV